MKNKKIRMLLLAIVLSISCFLTCFIPATNIVYASSIGVVGGYTNVLEDLQKDDTFNANDYPVIQDDYSLQVITIAESSDNELFVYVYHPIGDYSKSLARSIFISIDKSTMQFLNYYLDYVNSQGVFAKYRVKNFVVSTDSTRYYEITSIYRRYINNIDNELDNGNTTDEVEFKVAKSWTFTTNDTETTMLCQDLDVITITSKYVGFVRYEDGNWWHMWGESACDRHFVAFDTDKQIDKLMEADVFYQYQENVIYDPTLGIADTNYKYGEIKDGYAYLTYTQMGNYDNGHYNYTWDRIQSVDSFIESIDITTTYTCGIFDVENSSKITEENIGYLQEQKWVLSFLETGVEVTRSSEWETTYYTRVGSISILRLKFETNDVVYNLGVIDNKQSGSSEPINTWSTNVDLNNTFKLLLLMLLLILLVVVLNPVLPIVFKAIWFVIKTIIKITWWIISIPFKLLGAIFKKRE